MFHYLYDGSWYNDLYSSREVAGGNSDFWYEKCGLEMLLNWTGQFVHQFRQYLGTSYGVFSCSIDINMFFINSQTILSIHTSQLQTVTAIFGYISSCHHPTSSPAIILNYHENLWAAFFSNLFRIVSQPTHSPSSIVWNYKHRPGLSCTSTCFDVAVFFQLISN